MDQVTFRATWDETGSIGCIHLTKTELEEFITSAGSQNGEHVILILIKHHCNVALSEVSREFMMEADDLAFKLKLRFAIRRISELDEKRVQEIEECLQYGSMYHIYA